MDSGWVVVVGLVDVASVPEAHPEKLEPMLAMGHEITELMVQDWVCPEDI